MKEKEVQAKKRLQFSELISRLKNQLEFERRRNTAGRTHTLTHTLTHTHTHTHTYTAAIVSKHVRTIRDDESSIAALREDEEDKLAVSIRILTLVSP